MVAAMDRNRVIGRNNELPWRIPADMRRFVRVTRGKPVIMGRLTYESIGRPLPDRDNHVVTRNPAYAASGCTVHSTVQSALAATAAADETVVIGGAQIYAEALPLADYLYLTFIDAEFAGDTWFPEWDAQIWKAVWQEAHAADKQNAFAYEFVNLARTRAS